MLLTYPASMFCDSVVSKALHHFLYWHLEGCSCKLSSPLYYFSLFLSLSCVHAHAFVHVQSCSCLCVNTQGIIEPYWDHLICHSPHLHDWGARKCFTFIFQCSHSILQHPLPFFCQQRFCLPLLSVLTQKNKLLLICQCSLICSHTVFSRTSLQLRLLEWVG